MLVEVELLPPSRDASRRLRVVTFKTCSIYADWLHEAAEVLGVSVSELIRRAIDDYVRRYGLEPPRCWLHGP